MSDYDDICPARTDEADQQTGLDVLLRNHLGHHYTVQDGKYWAHCMAKAGISIRDLMEWMRTRAGVREKPTVDDLLHHFGKSARRQANGNASCRLCGGRVTLAAILAGDGLNWDWYDWSRVAWIAARKNQAEKPANHNTVNWQPVCCPHCRKQPRTDTRASGLVVPYRWRDNICFEMDHIFTTLNLAREFAGLQTLDPRPTPGGRIAAILSPTKSEKERQA